MAQLKTTQKTVQQKREETSQRITWGHWFTLFNILLALIIASRYGFNADWPNTLFGKVYFFISLFGHFGFIVFAVYLILLFPLSFIVKNQFVFRVLSVVLATLGLSALLVDTEVFKELFLHLSPITWELFSSQNKFELSNYQQLLIGFGIILAIEIIYAHISWRNLRSFNRQKCGKYIAGFFIACFIGTHLLYAWADMSLYRPITAQKSNYPLSYPMTARHFLAKHDLIDPTDLESKIENSGRLDAFYLDYPKNSLEISEPKRKINLMIINVSMLHNDDISMKNMPNLSKISLASMRFTQHYNGGDTEQSSISSLFYGLSGKYTDSILSVRSPSPLVDTLQKLDYKFGLFSADNFAEPIYRRALFSNLELPKAKGNDQAISKWKKWLAQNRVNPFFSYLALDLPKAAGYEQRTQQLDTQLADVWKELRERNVLNRTLVIITSELGNDGTYANSFNKQRIQVPMMMYWQNQTRHYEQYSSNLDIMPTLLTNFFGVTNPTSDYSQGIDLTKENNRKWLPTSDYEWNVAIMPDGSQYKINRKGDYQYINANGEMEKDNRPPLALFLQVIRNSNQFMAK